jgi:hypothetical protein
MEEAGCIALDMYPDGNGVLVLPNPLYDEHNLSAYLRHQVCREIRMLLVGTVEVSVTQMQLQI